MIHSLAIFNAGIAVGMAVILAFEEIYEFGRRFRQRRADRKQDQS